MLPQCGFSLTLQLFSLKPQYTLKFIKFSEHSIFIFNKKMSSTSLTFGGDSIAISFWFIHTMTFINHQRTINEESSRQSEMQFIIFLSQTFLLFCLWICCYLLNGFICFFDSFFKTEYLIFVCVCACVWISMNNSVTLVYFINQ